MAARSLLVLALSCFSRCNLLARKISRFLFFSLPSDDDESLSELEDSSLLDFLLFLRLESDSEEWRLLDLLLFRFLDFLCSFFDFFLNLFSLEVSDLVVVVDVLLLLGNLKSPLDVMAFDGVGFFCCRGSGLPM